MMDPLYSLATLRQRELQAEAAVERLAAAARRARDRRPVHRTLAGLARRTRQARVPRTASCTC